MEDADGDDVIAEGAQHEATILCDIKKSYLRCL
jgi:hypothetical protein